MLPKAWGAHRHPSEQFRVFKISVVVTEPKPLTRFQYILFRISINQYVPLQNNFSLLGWNIIFYDWLSIHSQRTLCTEVFWVFLLGGTFILLLANPIFQISGFGTFIFIWESLHCLERMLFKIDVLKHKAMEYWCGRVVTTVVCLFVFIQMSDNSTFYVLNICQLNDSFTQKHWPEFKFTSCSWKQ